MMGFQGISARAEAFLSALGENNNAAWFAANREAYEADVAGPLQSLWEALVPAMRALDPEFPLRAAGAVSRIRRDVRFSRDKSPFRTTQWITFKRGGKEWTARPAFFLEFGPGVCRHGMGFYQAGTRVMERLRLLACERPGEYAEAMVRAEHGGYTLEGDAYKRPKTPACQPESLPPTVMELHRRKNVYLAQHVPMAEALDNPGLAGMLRSAFASAGPLYHLWMLSAQCMTAPRENETR